jgi:gluconolactonase
MSETQADWQPNLRYPDPSIEVLDESFLNYRLASASVERIWTGGRWNEGPVYFGDGRFLLWSDIPNNTIMRWDETTCQVTPFRSPSNFANGNTRDRQGRLVTCEHGERRITRTEYDGSITIIMEHYNGKRLNSPNDLVVKSDGAIWFTDPVFGISSNYEGHKADPELPQNVYRIDPNTQKPSIVAQDILGPNGLAFSPDESILYLVESRAKPTRQVVAYDVVKNGTEVGASRKFIDAEGGTPDGFRVDNHGNLWMGWGMGGGLDGVRIFSPQGKAIGHIHLPERCANLCFGGLKRNRVFMAASHSIYALYVNTQGVAGG